MKAQRFPIAVSEEEALSILDAGTPEEVCQFSRSFLFFRKSRMDCLEAQIRILRNISRHTYSDPDCVLFSIVAASYKSCELKSQRHMEEFLAMIPYARKKVNNFKYSDSMRRNRTHVFWSINSAEAHLLFFLEDSVALQKHLSNCVSQAKSINLSDLKSSFFSTCAGVSRLLGMSLVSLTDPEKNQNNISKLITKVTAVGMMKRSESVELSGKMSSVKMSDYKHYFEFLGESRINAISQILVEQNNPFLDAALRLELLKACLRTVKDMPDDELKAKAARVFTGWPAATP